MSVSSHSTKMLLNHSTCKIFKSFVILRIKAIISDRNGAILKLGKWKVHFCLPWGIENNAKFNISLFPKISVMFFRNDSLTSEESKAKKKTVYEYLMCRTSYEYLK